jgi:hypothetical protein
VWIGGNRGAGDDQCGNEDGNQLHDCSPSNLMTSPGSGQRPTPCFENTVSPSRTTSNCDFSPFTADAGIPDAWSSAARLAARSS